MGNAFEETLKIFKLLQQTPPSPIVFQGKDHRLEGALPGPLPAKPIPVWTGAFRGRGLRLTGTYADGWFSPLNLYVPPSHVLERQQVIDAAAQAAGRDPRTIRRIYNIAGVVTPSGAGRESDGKPLVGPPSFWVDRISYYLNELGFDGFVFWPSQQPEAQIELFAAQVLPALKEQVTA